MIDLDNLPTNPPFMFPFSLNGIYVHELILLWIFMLVTSILRKTV